MLDGRPDSPPITIALAKGALLPEAIQCLQQVGIDFSRFLIPAIACCGLNPPPG